MNTDGVWREQAACSGLPAVLVDRYMFPQRGQSTRPGKHICTGCPVTTECLNYALTNRIKHGIWGGRSERERRQIRKTTP
jgi:WhiB family redox-sensing transcriptional regulator